MTDDTPVPAITKKRPRDRGMGSLFKPKGSRFYWIAYMSAGKRRYESTKTEDKTAAREVLKQRLGDVSKGIYVRPKMGTKTIDQGLRDVINNLTVNGRKSVEQVQRQIDKHLLTYFRPDQRMSTITTSDLTAYVKHRQDQGASAASCNNELATIRRAFMLAVRSEELVSKPHVPMLTLNNTRQGFLERHELDAILEPLPSCIKALLTFAYITGWRIKSEVLPLTASQVDLQAGVVRIEPGKTKNREARNFPITGELRVVLKAQLDAIEAFHQRGEIVPYVFHRPNGKRIMDFRHLWISACKTAGYPGKLLHDFRRSAVRSLERAAVPRSTAMAMVGHKTVSIYQRYAIVDEAMLQEGGVKLDAFTVDQKLKARAEAERKRGQLVQFEVRLKNG